MIMLYNRNTKEVAKLKIEIQEGYNTIEVIIKCPEITEDIIKMKSFLSSNAERLSCIKDGVTHLINKHDVFYFESVDKRCFSYTAGDVYETPLRLYELEELLSCSGFIRSSKSQIINISKIKTLCPDFGGRLEVEMVNGEILIVSRQYSKLIKERLGLK